MAILQLTDFATGRYQVSQVTSDNKSLQINESIQRIQDTILDKLLGVELKDLFDTEYVEPIPEKWSDLIDGKVYDNTNYSEKIRFDGIKEALKAFTYADFLNNDSFNTDAGQVRLMGKSTTTKLNGIELKQLRDQAFNDGVQIYQKARDFMYENIDDYPNWKYSNISFRK